MVDMVSTVVIPKTEKKYSYEVSNYEYNTKPQSKLYKEDTKEIAMVTFLHQHSIISFKTFHTDST